MILAIIACVVSILTFLGFGAFFASFAKRGADNILIRKKAIKQQQREEVKALIKESLKEELEPIVKDITVIKETIKVDEQGTLSCLRNDILTCYYRCNEKGYRNDYDYTNIHDMYEAYFKMGGNSFVEDIMRRFDELPTKEDYRRYHADDNAVERD